MTSSQEMALSVLKRPVVEQHTGLSRSGIYELMNRGEFPMPVRLSTRAVGWLSCEVQAWIRNRADQRDNHTKP